LERVHQRQRASSEMSGTSLVRAPLVRPVMRVGAVSGRRRIRTSVGIAGDLTDRSLWPLAHPPGTPDDSEQSGRTSGPSHRSCPGTLSMTAFARVLAVARGPVLEAGVAAERLT